MKVTLVGAASFRVGTVIVKKGVETEVDGAAFEHLSDNVKKFFQVGNGKAKAKKADKPE